MPSAPASSSPPTTHSGTLRISLKPLLPEIPGFGAAMVSLRQPPIVRFNLDFGKSMGGGYTAGAIKVRGPLCPFLAFFALLVANTVLQPQHDVPPPPRTSSSTPRSLSVRFLRRRPGWTPSCARLSPA